MGEWLHDEGGFVHGDIKLANMMRRKSDEQVMFIDFDAAVKISNNKVPDVGPPPTNIVTPHYYDWRRWEGQPANKDSDVYALGVAIAENLCNGIHDKLKKMTAENKPSHDHIATWITECIDEHRGKRPGRISYPHVEAMLYVAFAYTNSST